MFRLIFSLIIVFALAAPCIAGGSKHSYLEKDYQKAWCSANQGYSEFVLPDKTRVDCLTSDYAIEFDFAKKWAESIGQALYYSLITQKKPGVVLIIENQSKDEKYIKRLSTVAKTCNISIWTITPDELRALNSQNFQTAAKTSLPVR
jgi:hypothetical protein